MRKYFSVGSTAKLVSAFFQIDAQLTIIVDLAVQYYGDALVLIEDWLFTSDEVDDREAPHSERCSVGDEKSFRVRAAMNHALAHRVQEFSIARARWLVCISCCPAGYSAHVRELLIDRLVHDPIIPGKHFEL